MNLFLKQNSMAKLFTGGNKHNELANEAINASTRAFSYFFREGQKIMNLKDVNTVELYIFYVCQAWFMLESHILEMGADQDDQMRLLITIIYKFCDKAVYLTSSKNSVPENNNLDFWVQEFKKYLIMYKQTINEGGVAKLMQTTYGKIVKSNQDLESASGKVFLNSTYIASVYIEERLRELM